MNLTPTVSHLVALSAADTDIRYARTTHLVRLDPITLQRVIVATVDTPREPSGPPGSCAEVR